MFKMVVTAALALLLGLFIGGLGPRSDLRKTRAELEEARRQAAEQTPSALPLALDGLLRPGGGAPRPERSPAPPPRFVTPEPAPAERPDAGPRRRRGFRWDEEGLQTARAAAEVRAAQFRAAFLERAQLPPEKVRAVDESVQAMNDELTKTADELAESLRQRGRALTPRDIADATARVLEVYRHADDRLQGLFDERAKAAADETGFDPLTQIDLTAFRKLGETVEALGFRRRPGDNP